MRIFIILCMTLLTACAPEKGKPQWSEPTGCEIAEMAFPYAYDGVNVVKSDVYECKGSYGQSCIVYRSMNPPELYDTDCD